MYKGTWRGHIVAIKVLAESTPRKLFIREAGIWKSLQHPNVLELYGASSASSDPPWFFVCPYERNGSLVEFLRKVQASGVPGVFVEGNRSRTASLPGWEGVGGFISPGASQGRERGASTGHGVGLGLLGGANGGRRRSGSGASITGEISKEWDLLRFMHEIAKGMEYLHSQGVLHGDLKASLRCEVSRHSTELTVRDVLGCKCPCQRSDPLCYLGLWAK